MKSLFLRRGLLALASCLGIGAVAHADTVGMSNGKVYECKIVSRDKSPDGKIVIDTMIHGIRGQLTFNNKDVSKVMVRDLPADFFLPQKGVASPAAIVAPPQQHPAPAVAVPPQQNPAAPAVPVPEAAVAPAEGKPFVMKGNGTKNDDGAILLANGQRLTSVDSFKPPVTFKIVAQTNSTNLRLAYAASDIIFNWELDPTWLRIDGGPASGKHKKGAGQIPVNQWVEIDLTVAPDSLAIAVDGQERYRAEGDFSKVHQPLSVFPANGSTIEVKAVTVVSGNDSVAQTATFLTPTGRVPARQPEIRPALTSAAQVRQQQLERLQQLQQQRAAARGGEPDAAAQARRQQIELRHQQHLAPAQVGQPQPAAPANAQGQLQIPTVAQIQVPIMQTGIGGMPIPVGTFNLPLPLQINGLQLQSVEWTMEIADLAAQPPSDAQKLQLRHLTAERDKAEAQLKPLLKQLAQLSPQLAQLAAGQEEGLREVMAQLKEHPLAASGPAPVIKFSPKIPLQVQQSLQQSLDEMQRMKDPAYAATKQAQQAADMQKFADEMQKKAGERAEQAKQQEEAERQQREFQRGIEEAAKRVTGQ